MEKYLLKKELSHLGNTFSFSVKKTRSERPTPIISNSQYSAVKVTSSLNVQGTSQGRHETRKDHQGSADKPLSPLETEVACPVSIKSDNEFRSFHPRPFTKLAVQLSIKFSH